MGGCLKPLGYLRACHLQVVGQPRNQKALIFRVHLFVRLKPFERVHGTVGEVGSTNVYEPRNSEFSCSIDTPGVEHVGDYEIGFELVEELWELSFESLGECLQEFHCYVSCNGKIDGFHSFWHTRHVR